MTAGTVYWFTGLSGSGKTTLATAFCERLRSEGRTVVMLDGDRLRAVFGNDLGHSEGDRRASAMRNSRLCELLSSQGVDVVCATISLFTACHDWNREHLKSYREILVEAPLEVLHARDPHKLYERAARGEVRDVVGVDIIPEMPQSPDVRVLNDGHADPARMVDDIWRRLELRAPTS